MARNIVVSGGMPIDKPSISRPGVKYKESDMPGDAKWLEVPPEDPLRAKKGDLPMERIKDFDPRPNDSGKPPFKNLRNGR